METGFVGLFCVARVGYVAGDEDVWVRIGSNLQGWFDFDGVGLWVVEDGGEGLDQFSAGNTSCCDELLSETCTKKGKGRRGSTTTSACMTLPEDR